MGSATRCRHRHAAGSARIVGLAITGVAAALLLFASALHEARAADCPALSHLEIEVDAIHGEITRNATLTAFEIQQIAGPTNAMKHFPLLGMSGAAFSYALLVGDGTLELAPGQVCPLPDKLKARVGYINRTIFIAKEVQADPCLYKAFIDHQLRHAHVDDRAIDALVPKLRDALAAVTARIQPRPAPTAALARSTLSTEIGALLDPVIDANKIRRDQDHKAVDTPNELRRLADTCDGRGKRLARRGSEL